MSGLIKKAVRSSLNKAGFEVHRKAADVDNGVGNVTSIIEQLHIGHEAKFFRRRFYMNLSACTWEPHPVYSVFTQFDQNHYLEQKEEFMYKYRCFYCISQTVAPSRIIELGTHGGSGADAYLSGSPNAEYIGLDVFNKDTHRMTGEPYDPYKNASALLADRGYPSFKLINVNLRTLDRLPAMSDFVVVDAAHDFDNEYADLKLALTAEPTFIFVDDVDDINEARPAVEKFLTDDVSGQVEFVFELDYIGGGLLIKMKK